MVIAVLGCVFGILGILTIGLIFVPLAFLCALVGIPISIARREWSAAFVNVLGLLLAFAGVAASPVSLLAGLTMLGLAVGAGNSQH